MLEEEDHEANWAVFGEAFERGVNLATDFGFCAYGDAAGAIGGGTPAFYWFATKQEMLGALRAHGLFLHPPRSDIDLNATQRSIEKIIDTSDTVALENLRSALNKQLRGVSHFTWMGSFKDLCEGDNPNAQEIRTDFRRDIREGSADLREDSKGKMAIPIQPGELDAFAQFIGSYGI